MKRLMTLTIAIALTLVSASAFAKGPKGKKFQNLSEEERLEKMEDRLDKKMEHLTKELSLSKAQQTKIRTIIADAQTQRIQLREQNKGDRKAMRGEMKKIGEATSKSIQGVLNKDQNAKFQTLKQERKAKRKQKGRKHHGKKMQKLAKKLDLTDAQKTKVRAILESSAQEVKAVKESDLEKEAKRAKVKTIREGSRTQIEALLTADQKAKLSELKAKRGKKGKGKGNRGKRSD